VKPFRWLFLAMACALPALVLRFGGVHPTPLLALAIFGLAVVAAAFTLAWAAEAAQHDISGGLAIALLALIAVLPEYAVSLYFAYAAGHDPTFAAYAAANITGSNRLLLGLGWPLVVLIGIWVAKKAGQRTNALVLEPSMRTELGFLLVAGFVVLVVPVTANISLLLSVFLLAWFALYLYRMSHGAVEPPDLVGTSGAIAALPRTRRRWVVGGLFAFAAVTVLACAEPFAESLVQTGHQLGIDEFLLVQWLAPLASEAPEFIVAILFALRGNGSDAIGTLISSKVNQWTLLVGSLPIAYLAGGGGWHGLPLDDRQVEEMLLTAAQTLMGVGLLLTLRFPRWGAWALLLLFSVQFLVIGVHGRLIISGVYLAIAVVLFVRNRRLVWPTLTAPFRREPAPEPAPGPASA
jgi:cation:H+ antiporter